MHDTVHNTARLPPQGWPHASGPFLDDVFSFHEHADQDHIEHQVADEGASARPRARALARPHAQAPLLSRALCTTAGRTEDVP